MFRKTIDQEINLVLLQDSLAERLFELVTHNRKHLDTWFSWVEATNTPADTRCFIRNTLLAFADNVTLQCAIEYQDQLAGVAGFNSIDSLLKKAEVGYWLGEKYQGKGIVTRACRGLISYAFHELGMEAVQASVAEKNIRSRQVCERLNMNLEGVISNMERLHGEVINHAVYSLSKADWELLESRK